MAKGKNYVTWEQLVFWLLAAVAAYFTFSFAHYLIQSAVDEKIRAARLASRLVGYQDGVDAGVDIGIQRACRAAVKLADYKIDYYACYNSAVKER